MEFLTELLFALLGSGGVVSLIIAHFLNKNKDKDIEKIKRTCQEEKETVIESAFKPDKNHIVDEHDCKFCDIIMTDNKQYTVTIPRYKKVLCGEIEYDMITGIENGLKRSINAKAHGCGVSVEYITYDKKDFPEECNEIHIGSSFANNVTAKKMLLFGEKFKFVVPANAIVDSPYLTKDETHKEDFLGGCIITGLVLTFEGMSPENLCSHRDNFEKHNDRQLKCNNSIEITPKKPFIHEEAEKDFNIKIIGKAEISYGINGNNTETTTTKDNITVLKVKKGYYVKINSLTEKNWGFKLNSSILNGRNQAFVIRMQNEDNNKYIHLLFGTNIEGTKCAVEFLLRFHYKLVCKNQYFIHFSIPENGIITNEKWKEIAESYIEHKELLR